MSTESAREVTGQPVPNILLKLSTARAVVFTARQRQAERAQRYGEVPGQIYITAMYDQLTRTVNVLDEVHGPEHEVWAYNLATTAANAMRKEFGDNDALRGPSVTSLERQRAEMAAWAIRTVMDQVNEEVNFEGFMNGVVFMRPLDTSLPNV